MSSVLKVAAGAAATASVLAVAWRAAPAVVVFGGMNSDRGLYKAMTASKSRKKCKYVRAAVPYESKFCEALVAAIRRRWWLARVVVLTPKEEVGEGAWAWPIPSKDRLRPAGHAFCGMCARKFNTTSCVHTSLYEPQPGMVSVTYTPGEDLRVPRARLRGLVEGEQGGCS